MFGDVATQRKPVSAHSISRVQPTIGTTRSLHPIAKRSLYMRASSPTVIACRSGIGYRPMNDLNFGSRTGPSSSTPPIGLGRSRTHTSLPYCAADSITYAIVETYVYG